MWLGQGIAQKIRRWFLSIALIPLLLVGLFCVRYMRESLWDSKQTEIARSIVEMESGLQNLATTYRERLGLFAANKLPQDFLFEFNTLGAGQPEFLKEAHQVLLGEVEEFFDLSGLIAIRIAGKDGRVLFEHRRQNEEKGFSGGDGPWSGADDAPVHFFRGGDGQAYLVVSGPVFQHLSPHNHPIGTMTLVANLDETEGVLSASPWPIFLFDRGKKVVTHLPETLSVDLVPESIVEEGLQGKTGIAQLEGRVIVYRYLRETGGVLIALIEREEVFSPITQLTNAFAFGGLITVCLVLVLSANASGRIVKPLSHLVAGVESVASGNLDSRVEVRDKGEIGLLARRFNEMIDKIKARNKDLTSLKYALDQAAIVAVTDEKGVIQYVNDKFCVTSKYSRAEMVGQDYRILNSGSHPKVFFRTLWETIEKGAVWRGNIKNKAKDGVFFWVDTAVIPFLDHQGKPYQYLAIQTDITQRKEAEDKVRHLAQYYDSLTRLPNRTLFKRRLSQIIKQRSWGGPPFAVMFLDLDRFKLINDTLGHSVGDQLLLQVSDRLAACLRAEDTVARMGGDEFALLLPAIAKGEDAFLVGNKIVEALKRPFHISGQEVLATGSIGISLYPDHGEDTETLLKNADVAMYRAKEEGRGRFSIYTKTAKAGESGKLAMMSALSHAIEREEIRLHYQPLVDLKTGKIMGAEALIRWEREGRDLVPPAVFIPLAEECGLILGIGGWVLRTATAQLKSWQRAGFSPLTLAVNVAAPQFQESGFVDGLQEIMKEAGIDPNTLKLEITESLLVKHQGEVIPRLKALKALGVQLAIDDFGTGYSSLSYLKRFPVDTLKIDQSFVRNIPADQDDAAIAGMIVALAAQLKLNVVAEGIETKAQLAFLQDLGCDIGQGYLFSRPVPEAEMTALLKRASEDKVFLLS